MLGKIIKTLLFLKKDLAWRSASDNSLREPIAKLDEVINDLKNNFTEAAPEDLEKITINEKKNKEWTITTTTIKKTKTWASGWGKVAKKGKINKITKDTQSKTEWADPQ